MTKEVEDFSLGSIARLLSFRHQGKLVNYRVSQHNFNQIFLQIDKFHQLHRMSNLSFSDLAFSTNFCLVTLFDRKLRLSKNRQIDYFWHF